VPHVCRKPQPRLTAKKPFAVSPAFGSRQWRSLSTYWWFPVAKE
jgi:hypothetical protein